MVFPEPPTSSEASTIPESATRKDDFEYQRAVHVQEEPSWYAEDQAWSYMPLQDILDPLATELEKCKIMVVHSAYVHRWNALLTQYTAVMRRLHDSHASSQAIIDSTNALYKRLRLLEISLTQELQSALASKEPRSETPELLSFCTFCLHCSLKLTTYSC